MAGKSYYVRDTHGFYLGRRSLNSSHPRPWVPDPARAAVFTKSEAEDLVKMQNRDPEGPQPYVERAT